MNNNSISSTKMGVAGGTTMAFIANISTQDILHTILLTALGAIVSFSISFLMKLAVKWYREKRHKT